MTSQTTPKRVFVDSLSFSEASNLLTVLGVKFRERDSKFEGFYIPLSAEEGIAMARREGSLNMSGCCGNLSQFQSHFSTVWYDGDYWTSEELTKLMMSAHDHEGLEMFWLGQEKSMYGDASNETCVSYMKNTVRSKIFANGDPWSRFAAVWRISADHMRMGLSWLDLDKDKQDSLFQCYTGIAKAAMSIKMDNDANANANSFRDKHQEAASRRFHVLKGLRALYQAANFLMKEDLTPMECYGIVSDDNVVMETWNGPAVYTSKTAADAVAKMYSEAPHAKETPRVVRVHLTDEGIEVVG